MKKVASQSFLLFTLYLSTIGFVFASEDIGKGSLICSHNDMACGIVTSCDEDGCKLFQTHLIDRNFPVRIKPEYVGTILIKKSNMYPADDSVASMEKTVKAIIKNQSKDFAKQQLVCYSVHFTNVSGSETRCGTILSCNDSACRIRKTHLKTTIQTKGNRSTFSVVQYPLEYQSTEQIKKEDITREGEVVKDFIFWQLIDHAFIRVLY